MTEEERPHAALGGSTAHIWSECTGSYFLWQQMAKEPPSAAMKWGTQSHSLNEILLKDFLEHRMHGTDPEIRFELLKHNYDKAMWPLAYEYRDAVWENVFEHTITDKAFGIEDKFVINEKLGMYGYPDVWKVGKDDKALRGGYTVDYKSGYIFVDEKNNPQLAFYLLCLRTYVRSLGKDLDYGIGAIFQPRASRGPAFRPHKFTSAQLDRWETKFFKAAETIMVKKEAKFKVGPYCEYCRAKKICKAYIRATEAKMSLEIIDTPQIVIPKIDTLPEDKIIQIALHGDMLKDLVSSAKEWVINQHIAGRQLPGIKVVHAASKRRWKKNQVEVAKGLQALGLSDIFDSELKNLGDIERQLKSMGNSKKKCDELIAPLVDKPDGALTVVAADDPREAIQVESMEEISEEIKEIENKE